MGQIIIDEVNKDIFSVSSTSASAESLYSRPELLDVIVSPDKIELIYKRQYLVSTGYGMPAPEIYAEVYSRKDGSMYKKHGKYIPPTSESYIFENE